MTAIKQTFTMKGQPGHYGHNDLRIHDNDHTPSWKRSGGGTATLTVSAHVAPGNTWISLNTGEFGEKSSRETMLTIHDDAARALYEYLRTKFEGAEHVTIGGAVYRLPDAAPICGDGGKKKQ